MWYESIIGFVNQSTSPPLHPGPGVGQPRPVAPEPVERRRELGADRLHRVVDLAEPGDDLGVVGGVRVVVEGAGALVAHLPGGAGGQQLLVDLHEPLVGAGDGRPGAGAVELGRQQLLALGAALGGQQTTRTPGRRAAGPGRRRGPS